MAKQVKNAGQSLADLLIGVGETANESAAKWQYVSAEINVSNLKFGQLATIGVGFDHLIGVTDLIQETLDSPISPRIFNVEEQCNLHGGFPLFDGCRLWY